MLLVRLTTLTDNILRNIDELKEQARRAVPDFRQKMKASLNVEKFPQMELPASVAEEIGSEQGAESGPNPG